MIANSIDKKTFQLTDDKEQLGELIYKNLSFLKASIKLENSDVYDIEPVGFFNTSIIVSKNGIEIANLKMNWSGQIVLTFKDKQEYLFKVKGLFSNTFTIENKNSELLIQFHPRFSWSKFNYSYDIAYEKKQDTLFVLLGVYASNYFIASMSGATSGMA